MPIIIQKGYHTRPSMLQASKLPLQIGLRSRPTSFDDKPKKIYRKNCQHSEGVIGRAMSTITTLKSLKSAEPEPLRSP
jgi:hypothetical protein